MIIRPIVLIAGIVALGAAQFALAQDASTPKTRAQVQAEFAQAKANGLRFNGSRSTSLEHTQSQRSRAEVRAETRDAMAKGDPLSHGSASD